jgi:sporulation protein YlmC with PRC-barrel domain
MQRTIALAAAIALSVMGAAYGQQPEPDASHASGVTAPAASVSASTLSTLPAALTVTNWYKQNVYDPMDNKIGEITDVLVEKDGKIGAFIVSIGGSFLGLGEKDVAVPFSAIHATNRNDKWWLTMDMTKDVLKEAVGYKYDRAKTTWERS